MGGMSTAPSAENAAIFKARTNKWFAGLAWIVAGAGLVSTALSGQAEAVSGTGPLLLTAYLGWCCSGVRPLWSTTPA